MWYVSGLQKKKNENGWSFQSKMISLLFFSISLCLKQYKFKCTCTTNGTKDSEYNAIRFKFIMFFFLSLSFLRHVWINRSSLFFWKWPCEKFFQYSSEKKSQKRFNIPRKFTYRTNILTTCHWTCYPNIVWNIEKKKLLEEDDSHNKINQLTPAGKFVNSFNYYLFSFEFSTV